MTILAEATARDKIERAYDAPPLWYDVRGFFILKLSYRSSLLSQLRLFGRRLGPHHLEAAIGSGSLFELVLARRWLLGHERPRRIVGFDLAPAMLAGARRRFAGRPWVELLAADVAHLPFQSSSFDSVNVANAAHCFPNLGLALRELHRVVRTDGTLTMNVLLPPTGGSLSRRIAQHINNWGIHKGILESPIEADRVLGVLDECGFSVVHREIEGNALGIVAVRRGDGARGSNIEPPRARREPHR